MLPRAPARGLLAVLIALLYLAALPSYAQPIGEARPGDAQLGEGGTSLTEIASTVTGIQVGFAREYNKTTIWLRICADSPNFQLRSENVGKWQTEVFHRTAASGGCSPSPSSWWRMVYNADPNTGEVFRIYASANDAVLGEGDFMQRAARTDCRVTGYGTGVCTPSNPSVVSAPRLEIDEPGNGQTVQGSVTVRGWAADMGSLNGPGVSDVHVYVNDTFIGAAPYGESRPDVASHLGDARFGATGYRLSFDSRAFPDGAVRVRVFYRSAISGAWNGGERQITIANGPTGPTHTDTKLRAIAENGKTTVLLQVCGRGNNYRFRSALASGQVLFDRTYGAIDGCSPEYRAVINANPGETLRFYSTVMNDAISDQEFLNRRRDSCRIDALAVMRCQVGDTLPLPPPADPITPPPPPVVAPCDVPFFSQVDPRWKTHPLRTGYSPQTTCSSSCGTIGACGCTLTSTAMVFRYYGADTDPKRLSDCMGTRACAFYWDVARTSCAGGKVTGRQMYGFSWQNLAREVQLGPVVLGMSKAMSWGTQTHYVVVISGSGNQGSNYVINDPGVLQGAKLRLSNYTSRGWSLGAIHRYQGTRPTCTATAAAPEQPTLDVAEGSGEVYTAPQLTASTAPRITATVDGSADVLSMDETTYTLQLAAQSAGGAINEMRISSDTRPNNQWQPFTPYVRMQAGDTVTVTFKDASGNESVPLTVNPQLFQSEPLTTDSLLYLPLLLR